MNIRNLATSSIFLLITLSLIVSADGGTILVYSEPDFAGRPIACSGTEKCYVSEAISIRVLAGTCAQILDTRTKKMFFIKETIADTDYYYEGPLTSCPTHQKNLECPKGTFVKQIEWDVKSNLTEGVKLFCNKPESISSDEATTVYSHKASFSKSKVIECSAFNELTFTRNMSMEAYVDVNISPKTCVAVNKTASDETFECGRFTALSGIQFSIETETNYIKKSSPVCSDIPNIATFCKAEDEQILFWPPTNTHLRGNQITKTVGVGYKTSMSESERNEFHFYPQFGLDIEYPLSANFKDNVGESSKTGYDWGSAPKTTWQQEQNVTIEIETTSRCNTKFYEIVGKCSYMTVRPYYLKRVDDCLKGSFTTIEQIPHNIQKRSYKSVIPDSLKNNFQLN